MKPAFNVRQQSEIFIGPLADILSGVLPEGRVVVVSDSTIDRLYHSVLAQYDTVLIGLGESVKTMQTVEMIYRRFIELGVDRSTFVLAVGGGIVTDVAGFAASTYMRGVKFGFVSTTLAEALHDADVFLGVSKADTLTPEMLRTMSGNPIVMALANPDPEIAYDTAMLSRPDIIFATGRSDYPNQVNNVLGFPYIFRGALDVRATKINEEMKLAAAHALAELTRQPVPTMVLRAYGVEKLEFGRTYLIPKPLDPRLLCTVAPAVAKAAVESGVAKQPIADWDAYAESLRKRYQE